MGVSVGVWHYVNDIYNNTNDNKGERRQKEGYQKWEDIDRARGAKRN